jgi:hypothetical protein
VFKNGQSKEDSKTVVVVGGWEGGEIIRCQENDVASAFEHYFRSSRAL